LGPPLAWGEKSANLKAGAELPRSKGRGRDVLVLDGRDEGVSNNIRERAASQRPCILRVEIVVDFDTPVRLHPTVVRSSGATGISTIKPGIHVYDRR
jgi:hypothetical protein